MRPKTWTPATTARATAARSACALVLLSIFALAQPAVARAAEAPPAGTGEPAPAAGSEPEPAPAPAPMMTDEARAHYDEGLRLYGDRNFAGAIREFEAGFTLEPRREFLFGEAQAYRLAGDCARAVPLYEKFLGSGPSPLQVEATRLALDRCARRPPPLPVPPLAPAIRVPPPPPAPIAERFTWWHDRWALGALGAGLVATGVGLGFVVAAHSAADQANGLGTTHYSDYARLWDTAERRQTIGVATLAGGGALLAAGALRLLWVHRHAPSDRVQPQAPRAVTAIVAPASGGASVLGEVTF